jgi:aryl-alcohol dehydrogenase-like predicted oxidoreductase
MRYKPLGRTGLIVSELCLGTMTFGGSSGMWSAIGRTGQDEADRLVARALDAGINFIDTANVYGEGRSEEITGRALAASGRPRGDYVIATKVNGTMGKGPNDRGSSRAQIMDAVKASLKRLGTDHIDLYQLHGLDLVTPVEEIVRALDDLVRQGHVRYVGCSNWPAWKIMQALAIADRHGATRFASLQALYTIASRDIEREIAPLLADQGVGLMVWSPLAGGLLSGKYGRDGKGPEGARRVTFDFPPISKDRAFACIDAMRPIADRHGVSVARVALAWLLHRPLVTSIIIGARSADQLDDNIAATEVRLSAEELQALDAVSRLPSEYPGWMIERQNEGRPPA